MIRIDPPISVFLPAEDRISPGLCRRSAALPFPGDEAGAGDKSLPAYDIDVYFSMNRIRIVAVSLLMASEPGAR